MVISSVMVVPSVVLCVVTCLITLGLEPAEGAEGDVDWEGGAEDVVELGSAVGSAEESPPVVEDPSGGLSALSDPFVEPVSDPPLPEPLSVEPVLSAPPVDGSPLPDPFEESVLDGGGSSRFS